MILAAGLGTRLRPLTDRMPKALVPVGGTPVLEHVARRLAAAGADRIIVNVHHHAESVERFLRDLETRMDDVAVRFLVSHEPEMPLETGGGLARAAPLFRHDAPFLLHNVDVISDIDLGGLYRAHVASGALATLAVQRRSSSRRLLFDEDGLCGFEGTRTSEDARVTSRPPRGELDAFAFAGIHAISPAIFDLVPAGGAYSIIDAYVELAGAGNAIVPFDVSQAEWLEIGTPERLARARERFTGAPSGTRRSGETAPSARPKTSTEAEPYERSESAKQPTGRRDA